MEFEAVIFDLDGTLIETNGLHMKAALRALKEVSGKTFTPKQLAPLFGKPLSVWAEELIGRSASDALVERVVGRESELFRAMIGKKRLLSKKPESFLRGLKSRGLKLAIATGAHSVVVRMSLSEQQRLLFDCIVFPEMVPRGKPYPDELLFAADALGVRPADCLVVGDGLNDLLAAKAAGMQFVGKLHEFVSRKQFLKAGAWKEVSALQELDLLLG